jgi:septal ring factor EnvC (AmiA/AmiB activator)
MSAPMTLGALTDEELSAVRTLGDELDLGEKRLLATIAARERETAHERVISADLRKDFRELQGQQAARDEEIARLRKDAQATITELSNDLQRHLSRVAQLEAALREFIGWYDTYGFNCSNDQGYVGGWVDGLRVVMGTEP